MFVDASGGVGAAAGACGDFAALEVSEEFGPFLLGRGAVFLARAKRPAAGDERPVAVDHLFGIDGYWRSRILQLSECLSVASRDFGFDGLCGGSLAAAVGGGVSGPVAAAGALPGDGDGDVNSEHSGEQGCGKFGGELGQWRRGGLAGGAGAAGVIPGLEGGGGGGRLGGGRKRARGGGWPGAKPGPWGALSQLATEL